MALNLTVPNLPIPGQTFRNLPKPNFQPAIYALAIREPSPSFGLVAGYTFPLSPRSIRKEFAAMGAFFDVAGSPAQLGVLRTSTEFKIYVDGALVNTFSGADLYASAPNPIALFIGYADNYMINAPNSPTRQLRVYRISVWTA